jgi:cobalt-zinc-cadmium efflux system outer membrane protein
VINQNNANLLATSMLPNPLLLGDIQLLPLTRPFTVDAQGGPPQTDYQITYPIDWFVFGKRAAAMASSSANVRVSEADFANLVRQRVTDSAISFFDVLEARAALELSNQTLRYIKEVEEATRKAVEAGGRSANDLKRIKLDRLREEQNRRDIQATLTIALARLRSRMGFKEGDPAIDVVGSLDCPLTARPLSVDEAFALAEQNRPDIVSLRLQIDKAQRDLESERAKGYPTLSPMLGYTRQFQEKAIGFPDANSWTATVNMSIPLFDRNQAGVSRARSLLNQQILNLQAGLLDLRAEIVQTVVEFSNALRNAQVLVEEQTKTAAELRDSISLAYNAGGRSLLELLDARRTYQDTYRLLIAARANYLRSVVKFNSVIGKQVLPHDQHQTKQPAARP